MGCLSGHAGDGVTQFALQAFAHRPRRSSPTLRARHNRLDEGQAENHEIAW